MSLLDDVSIVVTPNGYKAGELYAVVPVPTEGAELVTNGDFATDSDWTKSGGATISGGQANIDGDGTSYVAITQTNVFTEGKRYKVTADVIITSGLGLKFQDGANNENIGFATTTGSYEFYFIATSNTSFVIGRRTGGTAFDSSIDNVSVKEVTSADMDVTRSTAATRVDENGLVNYAEIIGSEEVTNGDFSNDSDWTKGTGWTIGVDKAIYTGTANSNLEQGSILNSGINYILNYEVISSTLSGGIVKLSGETASAQNVLSQVVGTHSLIFTANGSSPEDFKIRIVINTSGSYEITNISVKQVDRDNVPRIDYTGGGCPHILAEPQRTNTLTYSEDFSQWATSGTTPTLTTGQLSPSGEYNATKISGTIGSSLIYLGGSSSSTTATRTIYARTVSGTGTARLMSRHNNVNNLFTLTEEWTRFELTGSDSLGGGDFYIDFRDSSQTLSEFIVWGGQSEEATYATSYIPTSGSTVTRNQDIFIRDGIGSLINDSEGVLFVEMAALSDDLTYRILSLSDGTDAERIYIQYTSTTNQVSAVVKTGSSTQANIQHTLTDETVFSKMAFKWKANDFAFWIDGVEVGTDTSGSVPSGLNRLALDRQLNTNTFFGKVKQLQVYDTALTDAQLTSLTS